MAAAPLATFASVSKLHSPATGLAIYPKGPRPVLARRGGLGFPKIIVEGALVRRERPRRETKPPEVAREFLGVAVSGVDDLRCALLDQPQQLLVVAVVAHGESIVGTEVLAVARVGRPPTEGHDDGPVPSLEAGEEPARAAHHRGDHEPRPTREVPLSWTCRVDGLPSL